MMAFDKEEYKLKKAQHAKIEKILNALGKKVFLGRRKSDGASIYLSLPQWECGWYWRFGYLGNANERYHLDGYQTQTRAFTTDKGELKVLTEQRNICMWDALKADYKLNPMLTDDKLWVFCELVQSIYTLKESAEVFGRGGSYMTANPAKKVIKRPHYAKQINEKMLPAMFNELYSLFI